MKIGNPARFITKSLLKSFTIILFENFLLTDAIQNI